MANYATSSLKLSDTYVNTLPYQLCETAAGTASKAVSAGDFALETGAAVIVKFKNTNSAANPTLNVSNTGAKAIYYKGAAITANYLKANYTYTFVYNGAQWDLIGEIADKEVELKAGNGISVSGETISLNSTFYDYLVRQTYATPTISTFTLSGTVNNGTATATIPTSVEKGTKIQINKFSHKETNKSNISGTLTLKRSTIDLMTDIQASEELVDVNVLDSEQTITTSITYKLSGQDTLGNDVSRSITISPYLYSYYGYSIKEELDSTEITELTRTSSSLASTDPTIQLGGQAAYVYLCTAATISSIKDKSTSFDFAYKKIGTVSITNSLGSTNNYNIYRSEKLLSANSKWSLNIT